MATSPLSLSGTELASTSGRARTTGVRRPRRVAGCVPEAFVPVRRAPAPAAHRRARRRWLRGRGGAGGCAGGVVPARYQRVSNLRASVCSGGSPSPASARAASSASVAADAMRQRAPVRKVRPAPPASESPA